MISNTTHSYQDAAVRSADSVQLVIMLHDMLIADLQRTIAAIKIGDVEVRTNEVAHALGVLGELQKGLDMGKGGEPAQQMARVYAHSRVALLRAQAQTSAPGFEQQLAMFISLRDAWKQAQAANRPSLDSTIAATLDQTSCNDWTV